MKSPDVPRNCGSCRFASNNDLGNFAVQCHLKVIGFGERGAIYPQRDFLDDDRPCHRFPHTLVDDQEMTGDVLLSWHRRREQAFRDGEAIGDEIMAAPIHERRIVAERLTAGREKRNRIITEMIRRRPGEV